MTLEPLEDLLSRADFVHLMVIHEGKKDTLYRISYRVDGQMHCRVALTLPELLSSFARTPGCKKCSRCGDIKPFAEFPRAPVKPDRPEGRHSHCKVCDRARKKGKYLRSKRFSGAGAPAAPAAAAAVQSPR